ncbi:MAG: hypothetical protein DRN71_02600 [Candidatus Nanohalarchaeota archaeon]|nr:MAG: hypothetical protein DRN71_02600 [Candidatus Nanohaloarchaeota archaeon]
MSMKKILIVEKRKKARELHRKGWSSRKIARNLVAGRDNVNKWIKMDASELSTDNRGWKKGKPRKYTRDAKSKIIKIRTNLEKEGSYFVGSLVVQNNYEKQTGKKVSESFVGRVLKDAGMTKSFGKKEKGRSKYMNYPQHTIRKLGKSMMSIDFIGLKYLKESSDRINFLSCKYIRPKKVGLTERIEGQTTEETIRILKEVWETHMIPEVLKVDNDSAFGANLSHEMCVGKLTYFLLNLGVSPLYVAPRSPWDNGEVEGHNSVFSKKFWNKLQFTDEDEIDVKIKGFNIEYEKYSKLISNNPVIKEDEIKHIDDFKDVDFDNKNVKGFRANHIYWLRIVRRKNEKGTDDEYGYVNILKHEIELPKDMINQFVFCVFDIKSKKMKINIEQDEGILKEVKNLDFVVNGMRY